MYCMHVAKTKIRRHKLLMQKGNAGFSNTA
jgi:hypothetical protein